MCNRKKMTGRNVNPGLTEPLLNHWSMTSDMQTPVVNEKQMPITAAETVNIQTSV